MLKNSGKIILDEWNLFPSDFFVYICNFKKVE